MERINWLNILHFYQPPFQDPDIVKKVTEECYLPVTGLLLEIPSAKSIVNINGCLLELLDTFQEGKEVIENLKFLISLGQVEITGTAKFHPLLPLINTKEIKTQVHRQEMSLHSFFGIEERPVIFYLPELAYRPEQSILFQGLGYHWLIIDEVSVKSGKAFMGTRLLKEKAKNIRLLVRERDLSESLENSPWRKYDIHTPGEFIKQARERVSDEGFIVTASDVEVFGHHHKERWKLLADIYRSPLISSIRMRDIVRRYKTEEVETVPASWSTNSDDISGQIYYPLWHHPRNRLHRLMWQLLDLTLEEVREVGSESQNKKADTLLTSCPFFWASCMPWWNGMIVEQAADDMLHLLADIEKCTDKTLTKAKKLREDIYGEVLLLNKTGRAKRLQDEFLTAKKIKRNDLQHLLG